MTSDFKIKLIGVINIFLILLFGILFKKGNDFKKKVLGTMNDDQLKNFRNAEKPRMDFDYLVFFLEIHNHDQVSYISMINKSLKAIQCLIILISILFLL